jgi:eukaryotic-like serine/threonine-protein kinase
VLEGSVRKAGNTVRVRTELIRADNGDNVWSETYDRDLKDIFKVQDEIAGRVVAVLKAALPGGAQPVNADQRTDNTEAYNRYLLGQHFLSQFNEASYRRAVDAYKKAIALDPHYAAAYAGLLFAEHSLSDKIGDPTGVARALAAAEQATALGPEDASGYGARGWLRTSVLWDWDGAAQDLSKAASIDAERFLAIRGDLAMAQGRTADALALQKRAVQRNPLVALEWSGLAGMLLDAGDLAGARDMARKALEIDPEFSVAKLNLVWLDLVESHADQALSGAQGIEDRDWNLQAVALAQHSLHHEHESQQALDALVRESARTAAYQIAEVYAWQGDKDQAFAWLDRAYRQRDG